MLKLLLRKINFLIIAVGVWSIRNHHLVRLIIEFMAD
jgi:hypothetical protein